MGGQSNAPTFRTWLYILMKVEVLYEGTHYWWKKKRLSAKWALGKKYCVVLCFGVPLKRVQGGRDFCVFHRHDRDLNSYARGASQATCANHFTSRDWPNNRVPRQERRGGGVPHPLYRRLCPYESTQVWIVFDVYESDRRSQKNGGFYIWWKVGRGHHSSPATRSTEAGVNK